MHNHHSFKNILYEKDLLTFNFTIKQDMNCENSFDVDIALCAVLLK